MAVCMCIIASGNRLPPKPKTRCCLAQVPGGWTQEWWPSGGVRVCDLVVSGVASSSLVPHLDRGLRNSLDAGWGWAETFVSGHPLLPL